MKRFVFYGLFAGLFCCTQVCGQNILKSLQNTVPGQGKITIQQDAQISALIGGQLPAEKTGQIITLSGFRIQAYAGNNTRKAKEEAHRTAERIKSIFPDVAVYTSFIPPRWICRMGDFRTIEEADAVMRKMREQGSFKEASIVKDQIKIQY